MTMRGRSADSQAPSCQVSDQAGRTGLVLGLLALAAVLPIVIFVVLVPGFWTDALWLLLLGSPVLAALALHRGVTQLRARRTPLTLLTLLSGLISFLLLAVVVTT